jgi:hypothetical protein
MLVRKSVISPNTLPRWQRRCRKERDSRERSAAFDRPCHAFFPVQQVFSCYWHAPIPALCIFCIRRCVLRVSLAVPSVADDSLVKRSNPVHRSRRVGNPQRCRRSNARISQSSWEAKYCAEQIFVEAVFGFLALVVGVLRSAPPLKEIAWESEMRSR